MLFITLHKTENLISDYAPSKSHIHSTVSHISRRTNIQTYN